MKKDLLVSLGIVLGFALFLFSPKAFAVQEDNEKVEVCHVTEGTNTFVKIEIDENALDAHLDHGDVLPDENGECPTENGEEDEKVDICHITGTGAFVLINVSENALEAHLSHGDVQPNEEGECPEDQNGDDDDDDDDNGTPTSTPTGGIGGGTVVVPTQGGIGGGVVDTQGGIGGGVLPSTGPTESILWPTLFAAVVTFFFLYKEKLQMN